MFPRMTNGFALLVLLLCTASPVAAQRKASGKDSLGAHMAAVAALRQFQYQYNILVTSAADQTRGGGSCEIRVEDFCYGPLNGQSAWGGISVYPVHRSLATSTVPRMWRRTSEFYVSRYMLELQRAQKTVPGDRWINAELVRMHMEHGFLGRAEAIVDKCKDDGWWCAALDAYVIYSTGDWQRADSAWSVVVSRMTTDERCAWLDPTLVIAERQARRTIEEFTCAQLTEFAARFWWLADPFYSRPGNERRSAHLSRVMKLIIDAATSDRTNAIPAVVRVGKVAELNPPMPTSADKSMMKSCINFGNDIPANQRRGVELLMMGWVELVTRLGVPSYCGRTSSESECFDAPCPPQSQFAQYPFSRQSFVPNAEAVTDHLHSLATDWKLRDPWAYEFISGWTRPIMDLTYQAAYFKRGDSSRLVIASELPVAGADGVMRPSTSQTRTELWLQSDFDAPRTRMTTTGTSRILFNFMVGAETFSRVSSPVANGGWRQRTLASIESDHSRGPLGRVRFATGPQEMPVQRVTISDALLFEEGASLPSNVEQATTRARASTTLRERSVTGVFWEIYGLLPGETPRVSILIVRQDGREPLRLGRGPTRPGGPDVVTTEWDEPPVNGAAIEPRSLNLSLATLRRGTYTLSVALSVPGQELVESVRTIEIVR